MSGCSTRFVNDCTQECMLVSGYGTSVCMIVTGVFASVWLWCQCVHDCNRSVC